MPVRKGRDFYPELYKKALSMHKDGKSIKDVAEKLGISYSCAYHWIKGIRKPEQGNLSLFLDFVKKNGPISAADIKKKFKKHNELFLVSSRRSLGVSRHVLKRKYGEYNTWYYIPGQEEKLKKRIKKMISRYNENIRKFTGEFV